MSRKRSTTTNRIKKPAEVVSASGKEEAGEAQVAEKLDVTDDVYRRVGREVLSGNLHPACWAKALAESKGEE